MKDIDEEVMLKVLDEDYPKPILIKNLGMMYATEKSNKKVRFGIYKCGFCEAEFKTNTYDVNRGNTKSCGCYHKKKVKESKLTHNLTNTKIYNIWSEIKNRTLNSKHKQYNDYGGRGITICEEWLDIHNFYNWAMSNGYEENRSLSIDRIDNNGNYEPSNCRWTNSTIQSRNQRIPKNNTSGYKGVSYHKRDNNFKAQIWVNKIHYYLGLFPTPVEGAIAYNNYIIENNLEGFILNEIPEEQKLKECANG
jgi:hypothetical protein